MVREFKKLGHLRYQGWYDSNIAGRKPAMKQTTIIKAIKDYKKATEGGEAVSKDTCHLFFSSFLFTI